MSFVHLKNHSLHQSFWMPREGRIARSHRKTPETGAKNGIGNFQESFPVVCRFGVQGRACHDSWPWMNLQNSWRSCTYSNVAYMDDDWCSQTYLQIPRFPWPSLFRLPFFELSWIANMHPLRWLAHYIISLVTKTALLAISPLETWALWMTLGVASLNCCWMTLNDSTWGGP